MCLHTQALAALPARPHPTHLGGSGAPVVPAGVTPQVRLTRVHATRPVAWPSPGRAGKTPLLSPVQRLLAKMKIWKKVWLSSVSVQSVRPPKTKAVEQEDAKKREGKNICGSCLGFFSSLVDFSSSPIVFCNDRIVLFNQEGGEPNVLLAPK